MTLTFNEYQKQAETTAVYPGMGERDGLNYVVLGLCGESGEVAEKLKKSYRDDGFVTEARRQAIRGELGDVLWYAAMLAGEIDEDLGDVAQENLDKLASRRQRNVITGDGDNR